MMRFLKIFGFTVSILVCVPLSGQEKTYKIYGDRHYTKQDKIKIWSGGRMYMMNLIDHLPDGKWYYYDEEDSSRRDIQYYLKIEGEYKDSLKDGTFKYYSTKITGKKDFHLRSIINYKEGKLHGELIIYSTEPPLLGIGKGRRFKILEANYYEGELHGFVIRYGFTRKGQLHPEWILVYDKGELKAWIVYDKEEKGKTIVVTDKIRAFGVGEEIPYYLW